jgi:3-hydroxyphenylacetate 6-hydroxylase
MLLRAKGNEALNQVPYHETYRQWSKTYGDVSQVELGNTTVITINSNKAARALFLGQSHAMNSRPTFYVFRKKVTQNVGAKPVLSIGTSPWDDSCKKRRKAAATALNRNRVESYGPILTLESREFLRYLLNISEGERKAVDFTMVVKRFALNLSLTLNYGTRVSDVKDMSDASLIKEVLYVEEEISNFRDTSKNYANYIPLLRYWEPIEQALGWGMQKKGHAADIGRRRLQYNKILQEKLEDEVKRGVDKPCIQGSVLRDPEASDLTAQELISVSLSMMAVSNSRHANIRWTLMISSQGAHSNQPTLIWAILLLAHRQDIQEKAYNEIRKAGVLDLSSNAYSETKVPYIDALTKEVSRFFVVLKLALPKATYTDVVWEGATIPANTTVFLNSWACNRGISTSIFFLRTVEC